ncbi:alpha/beta hydrolase [Mycolicibacterium sp.]|uniref:alpha/beta hydrolase n=1 Tax=Mycolicibacterium sp. TaxID=2320850 RepID=UPI001A1E20DC|nr:alpha/beta hydrolase [Mycolicibacterium sp.]MBJ7398749.1 hypothetical protein [Mycolicibacterium sp.]
MTLGPADIDRWDPDQVRAVSEAATARAESAEAVSVALAQLPSMSWWSGLAASAAYEAIAMIRLALNDHAEEARVVARATDKTAEDIDRLKSRLRNLDDDAHAANLIVDRITGTVVPDTGYRGNSAQFAADADPILSRLDAIVAEANAVDAELAQAISAAGNRFPIPRAPSVPTSPEYRRAWWDSLSQDAKDILLEKNSDELGNCDGLPVADRSVANIAVMTNDLDRIDRVVSAYDVPVGEIILEPSRFGLTMTDIMRYVNADGVKRGLDYNRSQTGAEVLLFLYKPLEFGGQGRAAIAIGDPDSADHTAVLVPGTGNSVANGWLADNDDAANLYAETLAATGRSQGVSVLAWMGYDTPDAIVDPRVAQTTLARRGGAVLAADVNALTVTHRGPSHVTVIGHSYGSTTVADAAAGYGMDADDVVLVGSPGTDLARTASDFHLRGAGHVYVGASSTDPITNLAGLPIAVPGLGLAPEPIGLGADPAADGFGSTRFKAEVRGWTLGSWTDHEHYFDNGSESLYSIADITSGHGTALQVHGMTAAHRDSLLGPLAPRLGLPDWSIPLMDPELTRPATAGHYHHPVGGGP